MVRQLRERNFILCFVGADSYAFVHRTFLEYFCAADFVQRFHVEKSLDIDGLIAKFDQHCRDDDWREVLRLICGQIDELFVGRIVERLATRTDSEKWDGRTPLPELPLAIWCLSELRSLARLDEIGDTLLATVVFLFRSVEVDLDQTFFEEIVCSADALGVRWPGQRSLPIADTLPSSAYCRQVYWPKFAASVLGDRTAVSELMMSQQYAVRRGATEALADKWPDGETRRLIEVRAVEDESQLTRSVALTTLADRWPGEKTLELLQKRARVDGVAASVFGGKFSDFGRIVFTRNLDGVRPYLDPVEPVSREHFKKAAKRARVPEDEIDETVRSLSAHMGWDIGKGSRG